MILSSRARIGKEPGEHVIRVIASLARARGGEGWVENLQGDAPRPEDLPKQLSWRGTRPGRPRGALGWHLMPRGGQNRKTREQHIAGGSYRADRHGPPPVGWACPEVPEGLNGGDRFAAAL